MPTNNISKTKTPDKEKLLDQLKELESKEAYYYASDKRFHCLFGRDSVITSLELLPYFPNVSKNTLVQLLKYQSKKGQISHETGIKNKMWDSLDSTPLFLILLSEYLKKTNDIEFVKTNFLKIKKSLSWCLEAGDLDKDGFLEYAEPKHAYNLIHHCWKDSRDGMQHPDGSAIKYPVAPVEIQAYFYKALIGMAFVYEKLGKDNKELINKAKVLKKEFNQKYWMKDEKFFALALDGDKKKVKNISSNIGHCLWSEIIDESKVDMVVKRMMKKDLLTVYGLRTLSDKMSNHDPFSYHNGSIWPFDNWFFVEGLEKYGYKKEAAKVREYVMAALTSLGSPYECYSYSNNELGLMLKDYGRNDLTPEKIQAWTLGAMYSFLMEKDSEN